MDIVKREEENYREVYIDLDIQTTLNSQETAERVEVALRKIPEFKFVLVTVNRN